MAAAGERRYGEEGDGVMAGEDLIETAINNLRERLAGENLDFCDVVEIAASIMSVVAIVDQMRDETRGAEE